MTHTKFPSIVQFRDIIRTVKDRTHWAGKDENGEPIFDRTRRLPELSFEGTVKLHGTNAAVVRNEDGSFHFQSRENIITPEKDNAGFALWASTINWEDFFFPFPEDSRVALFGEWCGGNIQNGVALNQLPKMFVIFKALVDDEWMLVESLQWPEKNIFNIRQFPKFNIVIDFENPANAQNPLIELTLAVEQECPVGKAFGISGVGEGIVWTCKEDKSLVFKVKGEKHSVSKVKTLVPVDAEKLANIAEFIDSTVTENRLNQALENIDELSTKCTGQFIRWVFNDILKEEADVIVASMLDEKEIGKAVANKAKTWFFERIKNV